MPYVSKNRALRSEGTGVDFFLKSIQRKYVVKHSKCFRLKLFPDFSNHQGGALGYPNFMYGLNISKGLSLRNIYCLKVVVECWLLQWLFFKVYIFQAKHSSPRSPERA